MGGTELKVEFRGWFRDVTVMHLSVKPPDKPLWGQERIFTIHIYCEGPQRSENPSSRPLKWLLVIII